MISDKYTLENFEKLPKNSKKREDYLKELQHEILYHLDSVAHKAFSDAAERLKELGHDVSETEHYFHAKHNSVSYEYANPKNDEHPRIWLDVQMGALSGYEPDPDYVPEETHSIGEKLKMLFTKK